MSRIAPVSLREHIERARVCEVLTQRFPNQNGMRALKITALL
jgi:hypothetical protein